MLSTAAWAELVAAALARGIPAVIDAISSGLEVRLVEGADGRPRVAEPVDQAALEAREGAVRRLAVGLVGDAERPPAGASYPVLPPDTVPSAPPADAVPSDDDIYDGEGW